MSFVHDDSEFPALLRIVATARKILLGLVEKDYWVTHTLWALHAQGFGVWFKGGTSLSKGFGIIQRFSEDLDLRIDPGQTSLSRVADWEREGAKLAEARRAHFVELSELLAVPGAKATLDLADTDRSWRKANVMVRYPGMALADLQPPMKTYVQLEVGDARVTPAIACDLSSFVHEELVRQGQLGRFTDNRPTRVRCVHPYVTLIEKLDALHRRVPREEINPSKFVRHFEDAARIILAEGTLPRLDEFAGPKALAEAMLSQGHIVALPRASDDAFALMAGKRTTEIRAASEAIDFMFWAPRMTIDEACQLIREWVRRVFG